MNKVRRYEVFIPIEIIEQFENAFGVKPNHADCECMLCEMFTSMISKKIHTPPKPEKTNPIEVQPEVKDVCGV